MVGSTMILAQRGKKNLAFKKGYKPKLTKYKAVYRARKGRVSSSYRNVIGGWLSRSLNPFPERLKVKMSYVSNGQLTTSSSNPGVMVPHKYLLQSIYDPYVGVGDYTATGWTEFNMLYYQYRVLGCMLKIIFTNTGASNTHAVVSLNQNEDLTNQTYNWCLTKNRMWERFIGPNGEEIKVFRRFIKPWELLGITRAEFVTNEDTKSVFTNSPSMGTFVQLAVICPDGASDKTLDYKIHIDYYVELLDVLQAEPV